MMLSQRCSRRGVAVVLALVVLTVIGVLMATAGQQITTARRIVENRRNLLQARWLVRAGFELAAAQLLTAPADYAGEEINLFAGARVKIEVSKEPGDAKSF